MIAIFDMDHVRIAVARWLKMVAVCKYRIREVDLEAGRMVALRDISRPADRFSDLKAWRHRERR